MNATVLLTAVDINIPGYLILKPIGEGGMASVFLAVQKSLEREVALKVMSPILAANAEFASRFLIEGKITAKLQHPNLVTVYDIGSHNGVYYLAAEYIPGGTLKERLAEGGLSVAEILDITSDLAQGLDFAHQKGFVHRDVKPGNVLFRNDGRVVLADFGIAKAMDGSNSSTVAGASIGTPDYMSPEQARGEPVDGRSDLYSLGTVLFEMLAGHPPYQASDPFTVALMHVTHPVPELPEEYRWLQPLVAGLMAKQAAERYNTGAAAIEGIHQLLASSPEAATLHHSSARKTGAGTRLSGSAATQQRTRVSLSKGRERSAWLVPGALLGVLAVAGLGWIYWPNRIPSQPVAAAPASAQFEPAATDAGGTPLRASFPVSAPALAADEIENALTQAEVYVAKGATAEGGGDHLQYPDEDNALYLYQRVLAAQPENARARKGIAAMVAYYRKYAHRACENGQWIPCSVIAHEGLKVDSEDATLIKLNVAAESGQRGESPTISPLPGG